MASGGTDSAEREAAIRAGRRGETHRSGLYGCMHAEGLARSREAGWSGAPSVGG